MKITVETIVRAPVEAVWKAWTAPGDIVRWNAASDDWHTTKTQVDLRVGGKFSSRMEAKDGSFGFDFAGTYTKVELHSLLECSFGERHLRIEFIPGPTALDRTDGVQHALRGSTRGGRHCNSGHHHLYDRREPGLHCPPSHSGLTRASGRQYQVPGMR